MPMGLTGSTGSLQGSSSPSRSMLAPQMVAPSSGETTEWELKCRRPQLSVPAAQADDIVHRRAVGVQPRRG